MDWTPVIGWSLVMLVVSLFYAFQTPEPDPDVLSELYGIAEIECSRGNRAYCADKAQIMQCINGVESQCPVNAGSGGNTLAWVAVIGSGLVFLVGLLGAAFNALLHSPTAVKAALYTGLVALIAFAALKYDESLRGKQAGLRLSSSSSSPEPNKTTSSSPRGYTGHDMLNAIRSMNPEKSERARERLRERAVEDALEAVKRNDREAKARAAQQGD